MIIYSKHPLLSTLYKQWQLWAISIFASTMLFLIAPSNSILATEVWAKSLFCTLLVAGLLITCILNYLSVASHRVSFEDNKVIKSLMTSPWRRELSFPALRLRHAELVQTGWQRRYNVANAYIYSLANDSAAIRLYAIPYEEAEELVRKVSEVAQEGDAGEVV